METNNFRIQSKGQVPIDFLNQRAKIKSKKAELELYFPGLFNKPLTTKPEGESKFAVELNKELSRSDIQAEIKTNPEKKKLYDAALGFQSLFIDRMLDSMRKNLKPENDPLYGGFRQKVFQDMLYDEYSTMLSKTDNFGIADDIYRQLERH